MTEPRRPKDYRQLVEAAREATSGLDERALEYTLRDVEREIDEPRTAPFRLVLAGAAGLAAALALAWAFVVAPSESFDAGGGSVEVAMLAGAVSGTDGGAFLAGGTLTFEEGARGRLDVGGVASLEVHGPARLDKPLEGPLVVSAGRATLSVRKCQPGTMFSVRAGDATVVVHGTRFEVSVRDEKLDGLKVSEGVVEVRGRRWSKPLRLSAGEGWGETSGLTASAVVLPAPAGEPSGHLSITTVPEGADVEIDGEAQGPSPLFVRLAPGAHRVRGQLADHVDASVEVSVVASQVAEAVLTLTRLPPQPDVEHDAQADRDVNSARAPKSKSLVAIERALRAGRCREVDRLARRVARADVAQAESLRAECQLRAGHKRAALALYVQVAERGGPTAEAASFETAKLLAELGRKGEALAAFEAHLAKYAQGRFVAEAAYRRCELLIDARQAAEARGCLEAYSAAWGMRARGAEALFLLATFARGDRRWADAAALYRRYIDSGAPARLEEASYFEVICLDRGHLPGLSEAIARYLEAFSEGFRANEVRALGR